MVIDIDKLVNYANTAKTGKTGNYQEKVAAYCTVFGKVLAGYKLSDSKTKFKIATFTDGTEVSVSAISKWIDRAMKS